MGTIAVTGAQGSIGGALVDRLVAADHRVIGIDVRDSDVIVDLSTPGGRRAMARDVDELCDGALDGLVVASGLGAGDPAAVVSVDFFGAIAALEGLRPLLEQGTDPSAVVIGSAAVTTSASVPLEVAEWCLAGDEPRARLVAAEQAGGVYSAAALALTLWARRASSAWRNHGVRLNVVAPGYVDGPNGEDWVVATDAEATPVPTGRVATPADVVPAIEFLLSTDSSYVNGVVLPVDGGSEAELRSDDWPRPIGY